MRPAASSTVPRQHLPPSARALLGVTPSLWDFVLLPLVLGSLFLIVWGTMQMAVPFQAGAGPTISLDPAVLPQYALRTTLRMAAALLASLLFTFAYATLAAKSERAGRILVPLLDILQSVPILGFLSITVVGFLRLFPGSLLGPEAAAIFAIFTSQAWNMAFSFYSSLRMMPKDLYEVAANFQFSAWQRFWRLEVPYAVPNLVWNAMMSVAGGWFFVVAAEAIQVEGYRIMLPGIGAYIAVAIERRDLAAIGWAVLAMLLVILATDQLLFRPLVAWADRFKFETTAAAEKPRSWLLWLLRQTHLAALLRNVLSLLRDALRRRLRRLPARMPHRQRTLGAGLRGRLRLAGRPLIAALQPRLVTTGRWLRRHAERLERNGDLLVLAVTAASLILLLRFVHGGVGNAEIAEVFLLGLATATRVVVLTCLASLLWVPLGIWIGLNPRISQRVQPLAIFLAAFPANLVFPLAVSGIVAWQLNPEIWLSPLMILGTQWYILFNVVGAAAALPGNLREAAASMGLRRWQLWRCLLLPGIFPAYVTGGLTASGGAWNASVVAEVVSWGHTTLTATGIGAYIAAQTSAGDHPRTALGVAVMSLYVVLLNRLVWQRLYRLARQRYSF